MYKFSIFLFLIFSSLLLSQEITVEREYRLNLDGNFAHAKFSPDSKSIFYTTDNYIGLYMYQLNTENSVKLSDAMSAGYEFSVNNAGTDVVFRSDNFDKGRKFSSIIQKNIVSGSESILAQNLRNCTPPQYLTSGKTVFIENGTLKEKGTAIESAENDVAVIMQGYDIALYQKGIKSIVKPLGNKHYIWVSLSPAKDKILFNVPGEGTYISDLAGNVIAELGYANAAQWSHDGNYVVYMKDYDDGHVVTSSDIYVIKADGTNEINLTDTDERIELYPSWSPDGSKIVFNTDSGDIIVTEIAIN